MALIKVRAIATGYDNVTLRLPGGDPFEIEERLFSPEWMARVDAAPVEEPRETAPASDEPAAEPPKPRAKPGKAKKN